LPPPCHAFAQRHTDNPETHRHTPVRLTHTHDTTPTRDAKVCAATSPPHTHHALAPRPRRASLRSSLSWRGRMVRIPHSSRPSRKPVAPARGAQLLVARVRRPRITDWASTLPQCIMRGATPLRRHPSTSLRMPRTCRAVPSASAVAQRRSRRSGERERSLRRSGERERRLRRSGERERDRSRLSYIFEKSPKPASSSSLEERRPLPPRWRRSGSYTEPPTTFGIGPPPLGVPHLKHALLLANTLAPHLVHVQSPSRAGGPPPLPPPYPPPPPPPYPPA